MNRSKDFYKYPLHERRPITDLRDMLNQSARLFPDRTAFLLKEPIPLREFAPRSAEALDFKANADDPYRELTYKQYNEDVRALGSALKELGIQADDMVCILAETRYEWYVSYLATVMGLAIVVPLDRNLPTHELLNNLERANAKAILYSASNRDKLVELEQDIPFVEHYVAMDLPQDEVTGAQPGTAKINGKDELYFWDMIKAGNNIRKSGDLSYDSLQIDPEAFSILLFTSGTTSKSKAVMLSHRNIASNAMYATSMVDFDNITVLSILPLHHTYEATCGFIMQIYMGNKIAVGDGLRHITKNAQQAKASMILMVPAILEAIYKRVTKTIQKDPDTAKKFNTGLKISNFLKKIRIDISKRIFSTVHDIFGGEMKYLIVGGAAIEPKILEFFGDLGFQAFQGYGLTEASPIFALNRDHYKESASAGLPVPYLEAKIINEDEHGIGEIIGRGPNIMLGYYQDEEKTREALDEEGYYHTGDYGYIDDRGFIFITGRKANIIVAKNGENVFPEELEFILAENGVVLESVVFGERDAETSEQIISVEVFPDAEYVKENLGDVELTGPEVQKAVEAAVTESNKKLQIHQKIRNVYLRDDAFPKNTSNKILRSRHQVH